MLATSMHLHEYSSAAGFSGRQLPQPCVSARRCALAQGTHRTCLQLAAAQNSDFGESVQRMARQVQGALPIVGLLSRIFTPTGGIGNDELSYPDYSRALYEQGIEPLNLAFIDFERKHGKYTCNMRNVLFCLWSCKDVGLVQPRAIMGAIRRLRVTSDMEVECDRFEQAKQETISKYSYMNRPRGGVQQQADMAVDALACLAGFADGAPIDDETAALLEPILVHGLYFSSPKVPMSDREAAAKQAIATRESRVKAYVS